MLLTVDDIIGYGRLFKDPISSPESQYSSPEPTTEGESSSGTSSGREVSSICGTVEAPHVLQMDLGHSPRVPSGIHKETTSQTTSSRNTPFQRSTGGFGQGNSRHVGQESNFQMLGQRGVLQFSLVPKKDKGWRPIINLKALNQYLKVQHFKMETINILQDILKKGDWMGKIDLKDAYLTVPISPQDQKFLRFRWREQAYQCTALPFGLAMAPRVFSKIMRPWVTLMREKGVRMIQYLDDILIMASTKEQFRAHMKLVMEML